MQHIPAHMQVNKLVKHTSISMVAFIFQNYRFHLKAEAEKYLIWNTEVLRVEIDAQERHSFLITVLSIRDTKMQTAIL